MTKINEKEKKSIEKLLDIEKKEKFDVFFTPQKAKYDFLQESEEEIPAQQIDFDSLINLTTKDLGEINKEKFSDDLNSILFYCKNCKKEIRAIRLPLKKPRKVQFECSICKNRNVIYGTSRGIKEYCERYK